MQTVQYTLAHNILMKSLINYVRQARKERELANKFAAIKGHMLANGREGPQAVEDGWMFFLDISRHKYNLTAEAVQRIAKSIDERRVLATKNMIEAERVESLKQSKRSKSIAYQLHLQQFRSLDYQLSCISPQNAHPLHAEATPIFKKAILDLIDAWSGAIHSTPRQTGGHSEFSIVNRVVLVMIPRFRQFELEFSYRTVEKKDTEPTEFIEKIVQISEYSISSNKDKCLDVPSRDFAANYMEKAEQRTDIPRRGPADFAHILLIAAADALMSEDVVNMFVSIGIDATGRPGERKTNIKFVLLDFDSADSINYCDFINAQKSYGYLSSLAGNS